MIINNKISICIVLKVQFGSKFYICLHGNIIILIFIKFLMNKFSDSLIL